MNKERTTTAVEVEDHQFDCTVVSFVPFLISEFKPGLYPGHFVIPASDTKTPQILHVSPSSHFVYLDVTRGHLRVSTPSLEVARSLVEDYISGQLGVNEGQTPGIFYIPGYHTLESIQQRFLPQCTLAKVKQNRWFLEVSKMADNDWNRYHQHNVISDFQRVAARLIGWDPIDHVWMSADSATVEMMVSTKCRFCGSQTGGYPKCPNCKEILNQEEYDKLKENKVPVEV